VLKHCSRRLGATVAVGGAEVESVDTVSAKSASEYGSAIRRFVYVVCHSLIVVVLASTNLKPKVQNTYASNMCFVSNTEQRRRQMVSPIHPDCVCACLDGDLGKWFL
jgi:hypothetical protein